MLTLQNKIDVYILTQGHTERVIYGSCLATTPHAIENISMLQSTNLCFSRCPSEMCGCGPVRGREASADATLPSVADADTPHWIRKLHVKLLHAVS